MIRKLILVAVVLCLGSGTAGAGRRYKVKVDSMPPGASIYLETREAGPVGTTPHTFQLERGTYTVILERDGYEPFSRTVKVTRNASFTYTLIPRPEPSTFSIEPAAGSEAGGADVLINGKKVGQVPVKVILRQGRYMVEVTKAGYNKWTQWIDVKQSENRTLLVNLVKATPKTARILVSSNISGAEVYLDGVKVATIPAILEEIKPGPHSLEVRAKGYLPGRKDVTLEGGQTAKVIIDLQPDEATLEASGGALQVLADPGRVEILVDGKSQGEAPVKIQGIPEGSHIVQGRKEGYLPAEQALEIKKGQFRTIKLVLQEQKTAPRTGSIRVLGNIFGAEVFIDGDPAGKVPLLKHELNPGPHLVAVRHEGYLNLVQTVEVIAGETTEMRADLLESEETRAKKKAAILAAKPRKKKKKQIRPRGITGNTSFSAHAILPRSFTTDVSLGFAHIFEGRFSVGVVQRKWFGLDMGLGFRTYGALTEVGMHSKFRLLNRDPFAVAAMLNLGGGGGPLGRDTFYTKLGVVGSMWINRYVNVSVRMYLSIYSDRLCPENPQPGNELDICSKTDRNQPGSTLANPFYDPALEAELGQVARDRFTDVRFMLSAIIEVPVHKRMNLFGILEGAPGQGNRWAYRDRFADLMHDDDYGIYGRVGISLKF